ncbi:MAG: carboxylating nicotinate-nucleotide diphosphorylase [Tissierellia bacterium]|nr:carboxylating nicotinate-nucleotide diphosphorylase [Tissierellia bacterium]
MGQGGLSHFLIDEYILAGLREDMNGEDVSTQALVGPRDWGRVDLLAKEEGILAGLGVFKRVFELLDPEVSFSFYKEDGDALEAGEKIGTLEGPIRALLSGERLALNFLQRMSGIASYTHQMVQALGETKTQLVDTRKTTPNFRLFEKYAVRVGGGRSHRYNLTDGVMLKDNHIGAAGSIKKAVQGARDYAPFVRKIEVEVEDMDQVQEALEARADIIMLDNMSPEKIREAVALIGGRAQVEVSGNISLENIRAYGQLGADFISSGSLTHSAPVLDLSLKGLKHIGSH